MESHAGLLFVIKLTTLLLLSLTKPCPDESSVNKCIDFMVGHLCVDYVTCYIYSGNDYLLLFHHVVLSHGQVNVVCHLNFFFDLQIYWIIFVLV